MVHELKPLTLRGVTFDPPLFCAPMAAITHSAFRRLLADFGGYGALFTEMLSAKMILHENRENSPWLKRRREEGKVIYQLMVMDTVSLPEIIERLAPLKPDGLDLNGACTAHTVLKQGGGTDLFDDINRLREIVKVMRKDFTGPLTVKIRLGSRNSDWRDRLRERLKLLEDEGVDALTIHPRFYEEKFKRSARHSLYAELASETSLPIIANGDITGIVSFRNNAEAFLSTAGIMIGRMAVACPWIFSRWHNPGLVVDHAEVWNRLCDYIIEDFLPVQAIIRIKIIAPYFARNFTFGHEFFKAVQSAPDWATARERASRFLAESPGLMKDISVSGI
jgi:tRNA-dihydrouridine synthase B